MGSSSAPDGIHAAAAVPRGTARSRGKTVSASISTMEKGTNWLKQSMQKCPQYCTSGSVAVPSITNNALPRSYRQRHLSKSFSRKKSVIFYEAQRCTCQDIRMHAIHVNSGASYVGFPTSLSKMAPPDESFQSRYPI